jgi:predicted O-methyltransferase YrrM
MLHFYETIHGWFNCKNLYERMVSLSLSDSKFVEVGAWKGQSAAYMAVEIINSEKNIEFYVVDTFLGSEEHQSEPNLDNLYEEFTKNIEPVKDAIKVIRRPSILAAKVFEDASLDFVYIDGSHRYEDVKDDIKAWLPKIKPNGLLAGDDYGTWPDVAKAVNELLPTATQEGTYWMYRNEL